MKTDPEVQARTIAGIASRCEDLKTRISLRTSTALSGTHTPILSNLKPFDPERPDKDNPEWTRAEMETARPASEVLPGLIGSKATEELLRRGKGWPPKHQK